MEYWYWNSFNFIFKKCEEESKFDDGRKHQGGYKVTTGESKEHEDSDKDGFGRSGLRFIGSLCQWEDHPNKNLKFCGNKTQKPRVYKSTKQLPLFHDLFNDKQLKGHPRH